MSYRFERQGRTRFAMAVIGGFWVGLLLAWWLLDMAWWIAAILLALTLPAAWEYATGARSWMEIDRRSLRWGSGRQEGEIALPRIAHIRLETRLDLSLRARVVLDTGDRVSVPQAATPPIAEAETAFAEAGVATQRHPFSLL